MDQSESGEVGVEGGEKANIFRTAVKEKSTSPVWNEEFVWLFSSAPEEVLLELSLWDTISPHGHGSAKFVGQAAVAVDRLAKHGQDNLVQVDVLSCHASLADRRAKLNMNIRLEQSSLLAHSCDKRLLQGQRMEDGSDKSPVREAAGTPPSQVELQRKRQQLEQQLQMHQMRLMLRQHQYTDPPSDLPVPDAIAKENEANRQNVTMATDGSPSNANVAEERNRNICTPASQVEAKHVSPKRNPPRSASMGGSKIASGADDSQAVSKAASKLHTLVEEKHEGKTAGSPEIDSSPPRKQGDMSTPPSSRGVPLALMEADEKMVIASHFVKLAPYMKMFQGVDVRLIERLSTCLSVLSCEGDTCIVEAGTEGHSMYFLIKGECSVFVMGKWISTLTAPCTFGEIALLLSEQRSADVRTSGYASVFSMREEERE